MAGGSDPPNGEGRLVVGLVRGVQGLRGALRVETLTDNPERFSVGSVLNAEGNDRPLTVISSIRDGPGLLVRFAEVTDRDSADALRDVYLEAQADADDLPPDAFYWHDVIGSRVTTHDGADLGVVKDIFRVGEAEVYTVEGPRGEVLIPAVASIVTELVPAERRIVVDADALGLARDGEPQNGE